MNPTFAPLTPDFTNAQFQEFSAVPFHNQSWAEPSTNISNIPPHFDAASWPNFDPLLTDNFDWSNLYDTSAFNLQLFTPATSVDNFSGVSYSRNPSVSLEHPPSGQIPSLSPGAQGNVMLYSPFSNNGSTIDEGYEDFSADLKKPGTDFSLFGESKPSSTGAAGLMFEDLENLQPPWPVSVADFSPQFGLHDDTMQVEDE